MKVTTVLFDVDGVLLDSLPEHLRICEDKNREYALGLTIPDGFALKEMVRRGTRISPMKAFFLAVGFPEHAAERADNDYQESFMRDYIPRPFPDLDSTLTELRNSGRKLGIVSSNVRANIVKALGRIMDMFEPTAIFTKDIIGNAPKSTGIALALAALGVASAEALYVGDQPADHEAAKEAGVNFLGVSYGWGISEEDQGFPVVRTIPEIYEYVSSLE